MSPVRPSALLHRGSVPADGFLFDFGTLSESDARARVLALWSPGAAVYRLPQGLLLVLPSPRRVHVGSAPGLPLLRVTGRSAAALTAAPLTSRELEVLSPPPGTVILVQAGETVVEPLSQERREDPAGWLALGEWQAVESASLGKAPPPVHIALDERPFEARERLRGIPPPAPELTALLAALRARREAAARAVLPPWLDGAARGAGEVVRRGLGALLRAAAGSASASARQHVGGGVRAPSALDRLAAAGKRMAARLLILTRLSTILGRQHAEYLARMMELFDKGDLAEALRHAIPLGGASLPGFSAPFLGFLGPRGDLSLGMGGLGAGSGIGLPEELLEHLKAMYRRAFDRLAEQGRIDEAVFVLAELLQAHEEAVAFLERHGRLRMAAELAEARGLPPGLVVRQWFIAGDRHRGILVARRSGAFADAVTRLERSDPQEARALRLLWADALASAGDYAAAVEACWPIPEGKALAADFIDRAVETGGPAGARALARKLVLLPETFPQVKEQVVDLLEDDDPEAAETRLAFARALRTGERQPGTVTLARAAARALTRDAAAGAGSASGADAKALAEFAGDGALKTDLPPVQPPKREALRERSWPLEVLLEPSDAGALPVFDAVMLPDGRTIAALGEAGARLLTRDGRTAAHFDQPCHRLVVSRLGDRAIALAERGEAYRLARLDFREYRSESWCEARLDAFAPDYDGSLWFAASPEGLVAVDALSPRYDALWRTKDVGKVSVIASSERHCSLVTEVREDRDAWGRRVQGPATWQRWTYTLSDLMLRYRDPMPAEEKTSRLAFAVTAEGQVVVLAAGLRGAGDAWDGYAATLSLGGSGNGVKLASGNVPPVLRPAVSGQWAAALFREGEDVVCHLADLRGNPRARLRLGGAKTASVRLTDERLTLADDRGRLLVLDLDYGATLRNFRVL